MNTRQFFADRGISLGLAVLAAVVVLAAPAAWADPPVRAARLNYVAGPVSLAPAGLPDEWGEAFVNRPITTGDRLWADSGGRAEMRLGSTALRIDAGTTLDVLDVDRLLQVAIDQGRAQVRTRGGAGGNAEIDTPAAAIVVNSASDVRVDVDGASGRTLIAVRFGRANIYTQSGESFDLATGETTRIDADGRYYSIGRAGPRDAFDNFAYARDTRWREPRYVSVEMTGYEDLDSYGTWQPAPEYGNVWFPRQIAADWVPYRDGRWVWVEPWGWTWVDNAPWGFAPFHYGRWVQVNNRWGWWPGERVVTPVYAPALVAFFGGEGLGVSVSVGAGPAVGWFPLGYRDPYIPWYTASPTYRRNVNVAYVRDPVVLNQVVNVTNINVTNVTNVRYAYRDRANVATVVPRQTFVSAQPVRPVAVSVPVQRIASANIIAAAPAAPERASFTGRPGRSDRAPRADRGNRPIVAVNAPAAAPPRFEQRAQEAQQAQGKPFEVKPLREDRRDDRRDARSDTVNRTAQPAAQPGAAPATTVAAPTGRDVRVIKPGATDSRQARDRGARPDNAAEGRTPPGQEPSRANATPPQGLPPQAAQQAQERAVPAQGLPPQAAPQAQDRAAPQREGQQREAQQREAQQREQQQREQRASQEREQQQRASDERAKGQRDAQERAAQQRDEQQRAAEERAKGQRDAQERANQQREQQKSAAEERAKGQREAQERATQERANQQREQQRAAEERAKGQREAQERANLQREQQQRAADERAKGQRDAQERANQQRTAQQQAQAQAQADAQSRRAQQQPAPQPQAEPKAAPGTKGGRDKADDRDDREDKERGKSGERHG